MRNVISGNSGVGILVASNGTFPPSGNLIAGNYIGTDATGKLALGNASDGVQLTGASSNTVGGTTIGAGNLISGNGTGTQPQISIAGTSQDNLVEGNLVGTDLTGRPQSAAACP